MSTVLVPLNETAFAEAILPDAMQLAGPGGRILLVYVVAHKPRDTDLAGETSDVDRYLTNEGGLLRSRGFQVETKVLVGGDIPRAIDDGVAQLGAEFVAAAAHADHGTRLARSSIAWKTLAHSTVPILLRHAQEGEVRDLDEKRSTPVKIMVPLDGSNMSEIALPLAASLAAQWEGSLLLIQVGSDAIEGQSYLDRTGQALSVPVERVTRHGSTVDALGQAAAELRITHVVMTSHGRTGLSRVIAGDVAAGLIESLRLPIVVIPSLAQQAAELRASGTAEVATASGTG